MSVKVVEVKMNHCLMMLAQFSMPSLHQIESKVVTFVDFFSRVKRLDGLCLSCITIFNILKYIKVKLFYF